MIRRLSLALAMIMACCALSLTTGCASIVSKATYPVMVSSLPQGAEFSVKDEDGEVVREGRTPVMVSLRAGGPYFNGGDYTVSFHKEGFDDTTLPIARSIDPWYIFNGFFVPGWLLVDPLTGAMWYLDDLHVNLKPSAQGGTVR